MAYDRRDIVAEPQPPQTAPATGELRARDELAALLEDGPGHELAWWLQRIAEETPLAIGTDFVNLRVLSTTGLLHLVAASGCTATEVRKRAFTPVHLDSVGPMLVDDDQSEVARSLGIRWIHVQWLAWDRERVGALTVGSRTRRRPTPGDLAFLDHVASGLANRLSEIDRSDAVLRACAMALAHLYRPTDWPSDPVVGRLRPRERAILDLYADGLGTEEIADLLVLSPHTVRTHVRNALRSLGVHSRDEAAALVRADQLAQLL